MLALADEAGSILSFSDANFYPTQHLQQNYGMVIYNDNYIANIYTGLQANNAPALSNIPATMTHDR